jgi:hypothetical protein
MKLHPGLVIGAIGIGSAAAAATTQTLVSDAAVRNDPRGRGLEDAQLPLGLGLLGGGFAAATTGAFLSVKRPTIGLSLIAGGMGMVVGGGASWLVSGLRLGTGTDAFADHVLGQFDRNRDGVLRRDDPAEMVRVEHDSDESSFSDDTTYDISKLAAAADDGDGVVTRTELERFAADRDNDVDGDGRLRGGELARLQRRYIDVSTS